MTVIFQCSLCVRAKKKICGNFSQMIDYNMAFKSGRRIEWAKVGDRARDGLVFYVMFGSEKWRKKNTYFYESATAAAAAQLTSPIVP